MSNISIEVDPDTIDKLTVTNLKSMRELLQGDLELRREGLGIAVFSIDQKEDVKKLKKLIKGFNRVIDYMTGPDEEE